MLFTRDHEYARLRGDLADVGISDYAQRHLGDVIFVDMPPLGAFLARGAPAAYVESVKSAMDVTCPLAGEVIAVNFRLTREPGLLNEDPEGAGWIFRIRISQRADADTLMDMASYSEFLRTLE